MAANFRCRPIELFIPEIKQLLETRSFEPLQDLLNEINPIDLADGFPDFNPEQQLLMFMLLRQVRMMEVFEELELKEQEYILQHLDDQSLTPLVQDIPADVVAKLFKKLPEKMVKKMSKHMHKEKIEVVQDFMDYPPHTVGAIMRSNFIHVGPDTTAKATMSLLQARSRVRVEEGHDVIFVTNGNRRLLGGVALRTLIAAPSDIPMKEIMSPMSPIRILVTMDREEASDIFSRYKIMTAPVVDENGRLVGVLDADDVIQVIEQETTEDIQKLGAIEALEEPYFKTNIFDVVKKRATWLCLLFFGQTLTATAMGFFEGEIARAAVLALFIPLVISSGGNSGSQAATLIVRALSLKEITFRDWWRVVEREFVSGLTLGLILGSLGFLGIAGWGTFAHLYGPHHLLVGLAVGLALVLIVLWGSVIGSLLPIFLKKLGLDPAVASAPFVATLVDVTGLVIYFTVSLLVLKGTLL
ncbi:MAG: Magnesium transporter MgtE [Elusimicrobia bacterium]|nr:Magnesium transporter MgtE [Elusimicrobiota bacterium]